MARKAFKTKIVAKRFAEKALLQCETPGCKDAARTGGRCAACYQGLRRLAKRAAESGLQYLDTYIYRMGRLQIRGNETRDNFLQTKQAANRRRRAA